MQRINKDPLHGITLKRVVTELEQKFGFEQLAEMANFKCFNQNPSINSCLNFFRKTPWAREKIEQLYLQHCQKNDLGDTYFP